MDYKEYEQMVIDTEHGSLQTYSKAMHAIMGMNGECIDILKKTMFQGHELDVDHLLNELGDVCWYTMLLIVDLDIYPDFVFRYVDRLVHVNSIKEKPTDMGLNYILDLNRDCGQVVDYYYDSRSNPQVTLVALRSIFYNIKKAANIYNKTLEDIFDINYEKIKKRYPHGFNPTMSIKRNGGINMIIKTLVPKLGDAMHYLGKPVSDGCGARIGSITEVTDVGDHYELFMTIPSVEPKISNSMYSMCYGKIKE